MAFSHTLLRSVFDRLALTSCIVAPLTAIVLVAPLDAALARSGGSNGNYGSSAPTQSYVATPVKQPIRHPIDRCIEHGGCSGVIRPVGSPKPLQPYPVSFPIGAKPTTGSGGAWVDTSGAYPIGSGSEGTGTGAGGTPVNAPPTKSPAPTDPGHGAPPKGSGGGGPADGGSPTDNGGSAIK
jgi:hypothetical protein